MKPHKNAEALIALADGNIVEWKTVEGHWYKFEIPDTEYRIKPELIIDEIRYMYVEANSEDINMKNNCVGGVNLKLIFNDGELKSAEVLK